MQIYKNTAYTLNHKDNMYKTLDGKNIKVNKSLLNGS